MTSTFKDRIQFLARFAYIGSSFHGVQEQPNVTTVLGALRKRIEDAAGERARALCVAARTDRGVHALQNFATFRLSTNLNTHDFLNAVMTPRDDGLFAMSVKIVSPHVHARGNARGKRYRYHVVDGSFDKNFDHPFAWKIEPHLCALRMRAAAEFFIGEMDFSSLRGGGCQAGSAVKKIAAIIIRNPQPGFFAFEIVGNGFLRKMIRNLVGLLLEVGVGLRDPFSMPHIIAEKNRNAAGISAPAHGLFLVSVDFVDEDERLTQGVFLHLPLPRERERAEGEGKNMQKDCAHSRPHPNPLPLFAGEGE